MGSLGVPHTTIMIVTLNDVFGSLAGIHRYDDVIECELDGRCFSEETGQLLGGGNGRLDLRTRATFGELKSVIGHRKRPAVGAESHKIPPRICKFQNKQSDSCRCIQKSQDEEARFS